MRPAMLAAAMALAAYQGADAQNLRNFCAAAAKPVQADYRLPEAVRAAFGSVHFDSTAEECIFPLKVLHYASADVLLTQGNVPGEACHGCSAHLSAYVLRRAAGELKLAKRLIDFAEVGTFGSAGDITPLTIGGDDGMVIEGGGTFQGYTFVNLDFYAFKAGQVVHLVAEPAITIEANNGGAITDERQAIDVAGSWSIPAVPGTELAVDYKIKARGRSRIEHLVWTLYNSRLVLTHGRMPPEVEQASGGG